jgi:hypothetical protein
MYGHMNVKNVTIIVRYRKGSLVYFKLYNWQYYGIYVRCYNFSQRDMMTFEKVKWDLMFWQQWKWRLLWGCSAAYFDTNLVTFWENLLHSYGDVLVMWEEQDIDAGRGGGGGQNCLMKPLGENCIKKEHC